MSQRENVLIVIKPDGLSKAIVGPVFTQFFDGGLKLIGLKLVQVTPKLAKAHYGHLKNEPFFNEIVSYITGKLHNAPVVAMVWTGKDAIKRARAIAGATNPEKAHPRTVRGRFGRITTAGVFENVVHVSSDASEAEREIKLWFKSNELLKGDNV